MFLSIHVILIFFLNVIHVVSANWHKEQAQWLALMGFSALMLVKLSIKNCYFMKFVGHVMYKLSTQIVVLVCWDNSNVG
jgi:hypothetical protein